jgi:DNA-binding beta-propeller fold protein YncE
MRKLVLLLTSVLIAFAALYSQRARLLAVGRSGNGFVLNTGWRIQPAGTDIPLSTLPMSHALSPDGRRVAVLNGGYNPASVSLIDPASARVITSVEIGDGWRGLAFSGSGKTLYAGNGARGSISEISADGGLTTHRKIDLFPGEKAGSPHLISDIAVNGVDLLVADGEQDRVVVVDTKAGKPIRSFATARNPYAMVISPQERSVWISSWSTSQIVEYDIASGKEITRVTTGPHPTEMVWLSASRLAVACANTNHIWILEKNGESWRVKEKLNLALAPRQPVGMTPSALSLSADKRTLYVTCSDANAVAVVDVGGEDSNVLGFLPTGWYPTGVRVLPDGRLLVLNGKGLGSHPNPDGPNPNRWPVPGGALKTRMQYVASIQIGSASLIDRFDERQLEDYTRTVRENSPYRDALLEDAGVPDGNPIPKIPGGPTPIQHVILLMKENRTYDQVLGDLKEGNGDPSLVLFGENVTPNHHKLAREFVLLDNFYVNADVSADGYYWTTAAISPDVNQRTWPMEYARRVYAKPRPTAEGIRIAPGGHIWDRAAEAGVSFYNYGFAAITLAHPPDKGIQIQDVEDPVLKPHTNYRFRQHDRSYSDIDRIQVFLDDLARWEKQGDMPKLILMTLGNDHTEGTRPGIRAPISCVADNDQAFGAMVEGLTKSKFWSSTAMFVLEDDAQDGADHVDSHRSIAYVISPYTKRHAVDSSLYNTTSVLRTIELILGLKPMTVFDAAARPMWNSFQTTADARGYTNEPPRVSLTQKNPPTSLTAARSEKLDFSASDRADDDELNDILWLAIKGTPAPAPVHSSFSR